MSGLRPEANVRFRPRADIRRQSGDNASKARRECSRSARGTSRSARPNLFSVTAFSVGGMTPGLPVALGGRQLEAGETPVRQGVEPGFEEAFAVVLVVEIVGVLPEVADHQRR